MKPEEARSGSDLKKIRSRVTLGRIKTKTGQSFQIVLSLKSVLRLVRSLDLRKLSLRPERVD